MVVVFVFVFNVPPTAKVIWRRDKPWYNYIEPVHEISNNLTFRHSIDLDEPLQPPVKLGNSKWYLVSSLTIIEYSSD